jgi:CRISPR-associated endoribonuclease Cas6
MFASFILHLRPLTPLSVQRHIGRYVNGMVYHLLGAVDSTLSAWVHDEADPKPFTVSPLQGTFRRIDGEWCAVPQEVYQVRGTVLMPALYEAIGDALLSLYTGTRELRIDTATFHIEQLSIPPAPAPRVGVCRPADLLAAAGTSRDITLAFLSPTAFKRDKQHLLFPQPWNVFGSLARSWTAFADLPLVADLAAFYENEVAVSRHRLETQVIPGGKFQLIGFIGECTFRLPARADNEMVRHLNALADFAMYAGVGMKTTQGMGQVGRVLA